MDDLKPCPFCGGSNIIDTSNGVESCMLNCDDCGAEGPSAKNYVKATVAWNTRAQLSAQSVSAVQPVEDIEGDLPDFNDDRVKTVYELLCAMDTPPAGEHWEGFVARRIVAALALQSVSEQKGDV
jgi:Lar family restriction alleviation protein